MARTKNTRNSKKPRARKSTKQTATNGAQISNANASTKVVGRSRESFVHDAQRLEMKLKEEWKRCMQGLHQMRQHKEDEIVKLSDVVCCYYRVVCRMVESNMFTRIFLWCVVGV